MWLPTRVYNAIPAIYIVVGLALLASATYINSYSNLAPIYFVLGAVSVLSGVIVRQRRRRNRRNNQESEDNSQG